jgi:hypothetical protein
MNTRKRPQAACHPDRPHLAKGKCKKCYDKQWGKFNRARMNKNARKWARENPLKAKAIQLRYNYGIELPDYIALLCAQDGLCKICARRPATDLDHNHATKQTRSVLCGNCNRALGLFDEDKETLLTAVRYLELWERAASNERRVA